MSRWLPVFYLAGTAPVKPPECYILHTIKQQATDGRSQNLVYEKANFLYSRYREIYLSRKYNQIIPRRLLGIEKYRDKASLQLLQPIYPGTGSINLSRFYKNIKGKIKWS